MEHKAPSKLKIWVARLALPLVVACLVVLTVWQGPSWWSFFTDQEKISRWTREWGLWAPLLFMALQFLQVVIFVIPGEVVQIAGGYLFGVFWGTLYSVVGIAAGSAVCFFLSRTLGTGFVHAIAGAENVRKFDHLMASPKLVGGFFLLFLIPGIPKDILCYVAGLSRMRFLAFLVITTLARFPGILASSFMGKSFAEGNWILLASVAAAASVLFLTGWKFRTKIVGWISRYAISPPKDQEENGPS